MPGGKGIDEVDHLALSIFFLAFGREGINATIDELNLPEGSFQEGKDEMVLSEIDTQT